MDQTTIIAYVVGIIAVFFIGRIFIGPVKLLGKLLVNSVLGGILLVIINTVGASFRISYRAKYNYGFICWNARNTGEYSACVT